jgi:hypothetical protein
MTMTTTTTALYAAQRASVDTPTLNPPDTRGTDPGSPDLLPEPAPCGLCDGSIAQLAMLLTEADEQDRTASRQIEDVADQAASQDENDRVVQMRAKASADENQAFASGLGDIAGGACMVGGAVFTPGSGSQGGLSESPDTSHGIDWSGALNGGGKALPGVGQIVAGQYKGAADRADADAARFDAQAQADIRRYNQAESDAQAANASMQRVEQFLDQIQQTENATRLSAASYRG